MDIWRGVGMDLYAAINKVEENLGLIQPDKAASAQSGVPSAADNDRSLAELRGMMGNIMGGLK